MAETLVIAHRTCPLDAVENSLAGLAVAARSGADGVEIDLRMSLDQRPFLLHDWTLRRLTGWPLPLELTPSALVRRRRLPNGEPVPALDAALDALDPSLLLAVDAKTPWAVLPLLAQIERRRLQHRLLLWCTSARAVAYAARRAPLVEVAYLNDVLEPGAKRDFLRRAVRLGARAVSAHWQAIDAAFVAEAHGLGLRVYSYHGRAELTPDKLRAGLDGLITDVPAAARAALAAV